MGVLSRRTDRATFAYEDLELTLNGELATEIDRLEQEVEQARTTSSREDRLGKKAQADEKAQQLEDFKDRIADDIFAMRWRSIGAEKWAKVISKHPAQRGVPLDAQLGYNIDAVTKAVTEDVAHVIEDGTPVKPDPEEWPAFWDALTPAQFAKIRDVVWGLNSTGLDVDRLKKA